MFRLRPKLPVERLDERVVGRLARPREVEHDVLLIGPQVAVAGDELGTLVNPDRLRIGMFATDSFEGGDDILPTIAVAGIDGWREARPDVDDGQNAQLSFRSRVDRERNPLPRFGCISSPPSCLPAASPSPAVSAFCCSTEALTLCTACMFS